MRQSVKTQMRATVLPKMPHRFQDGLGYKLSRAAKVVQAAVDQVIKPLGLTRLSWTVLASIGFDGFNTPGSIARHIGIERTAVSRILRQMEADGLIERQNDEQDGRAFRIGLTDAGAELCATVPERLVSVMAPLHDRLTPAQLRGLFEALDLLAQSDTPVWRSANE
ncbi:MAG: MarR family transcriptional regulator [Pseudomonadota bacterium]